MGTKKPYLFVPGLNRHERRKLEAESRTRAGRKSLAREFMLENCRRIAKDGVALKFLHSAERRRQEQAAIAKPVRKARTKKAA